MWNGKEGFDFLGMHHRRMKSNETNKDNCIKKHQRYPSRKSHEEDESRNQKNVNGQKSVDLQRKEGFDKDLNRKSWLGRVLFHRNKCEHGCRN